MFQTPQRHYKVINIHSPVLALKKFVCSAPFLGSLSKYKLFTYIFVFINYAQQKHQIIYCIGVLAQLVNDLYVHKIANKF